MRRRLEQMVAARKPNNPVAVAFKRGSVTGQLVLAVHAGTSEKSIRDHAISDASAGQRLEGLEQELAKLKNSEVATEIKGLNSLTGNLKAFLIAVRNINTSLSERTVTGLIRARAQVQRKEQEAKETGTARFAQLGIKYAESHEFKDFMVSAAAFMELRGEEDGCPYCDRPFEERGRELRDAYATFLTSTTEKELAGVLHQFREGLSRLEQIDFPILDASKTLFTQLQKDEAGKQLTATYVEAIRMATKYRDNLLTELNGTTEVSTPGGLTIPEETIVGYAKSVQDQIEELKKLDPATEIKKKEAEVALLRDRIKLGEELDNVITYLNELQWCENARQQCGQLVTNSVTSKQREFFNKYVTDDYLKIFDKECKKLNAELKVEILQQGAKGKTIRDLKIKGVDPRKVLSEGEQRATALADFLTEIQVSGNCSGLVFDDPVTSLDHERKKLIAKRIVEEANNRQAIVFTHDLVFVAKLKEAIEKESCEFVCHWIEKDEKGPGAVNLNNGPVNEADYKKSGIAQKWLLKAKQAGSPEERQAFLRLGFAAVRTNYEAFIIYDMFNEVYTRFGERISAGRLNGVVIDEGIIRQIIEKSGSLSKYIEAHLHSDQYAEFKPTTDMLKKEIDEFDAMKSRMKAIKKERSQKA
jgi:hypothetical protein